MLALLAGSSGALRVCGLEVANAKLSPSSRALDDYHRDGWPSAFPYSSDDLTPMMAGGDGLFYLLPKFVQHAGEECRSSISECYRSLL